MSKLKCKAAYFTSALCCLSISMLQSCDKSEIDKKIVITQLVGFRDDYERIVRSMAHDSLAGRWFKGDGIRKTENFVKNEFKRIGLDIKTEYPNYLQPITLQTGKVLINKAFLNNGTLISSDLIILPGFTSDVVDLNKSVRVTYLKGDLDFYSQQRNHIKQLINRTVGPNELVVVPKKFKSELNELRALYETQFIFKQTKVESDKLIALWGSNQFSTIYVSSDATQITDFLVDYQLEKKLVNNVVGILPGKSKASEIVIFSAHIDHLGSFSDPIDSIANGANDNASGVAATIVLADYFKQKNNNERTLMFIGFNAEEVGLLGSQDFADRHGDHRSIKCVINIDMIANESNYGWGQAFLSGSKRSKLLSILNKNLGGTGLEIHPEPTDVNIYSRSDNYPFATKGIIAHTISTFNKSDPYYHSTNDEVEKINFGASFQIVEAISYATKTLISGEDIP